MPDYFEHIIMPICHVTLKAVLSHIYYYYQLCIFSKNRITKAESPSRQTEQVSERAGVGRSSSLLALKLIHNLPHGPTFLGSAHFFEEHKKPKGILSDTNKT